MGHFLSCQWAHESGEKILIISKWIAEYECIQTYKWRERGANYEN